jgi:REP element-mobilizing transposase RayT
MIYAFHSIFSMYGFWMPNDPRGSGSDYVAQWDLFRFGPATPVKTCRSVATKRHDRTIRLAAKNSLKYPPVQVTGLQARTIVEGFALAITAADYRIHACSVLPEHVHLVIGWHPRRIRQIVGHLKAKATTQLKRAQLWPDSDRSLWGEHGWNVYLDSHEAVRRAIEYVEQNPIKEGKRRQFWSIVTTYNPEEARSRASQATGLNPRRIGGAALRSREQKLQALSKHSKT